MKIDQHNRYSNYTYNELKALFHDKISKENFRVKNGKDVVFQDIIPIKQFDVVTGEEELVDVQIINYVLTPDGKIKKVMEGERVPEDIKKTKKDKKNDDKLNEKNKDENSSSKINSSNKDNNSISILHDKPLTYMCSNGETSDGLISKITPTESFVHVSFHEQQHLLARDMEAFLNDEKIFLQYIRLMTDFDPITGKIYVKGGRAVVIKGKSVYKNKTNHPQSLYPKPLQYQPSHN